MMPSALKRGCKSQRQRQAQNKTREAYNFRKDSRLSSNPPPPPPPPPFSFLLRKPGIHSFKYVANPIQNEKDHAHPDIENLSFFFFLSPLFFSFLFFSSPSQFLFFFLLFFSLNSLHFIHLQSRELPQSISDFPNSINTPLFPRSIAGHIYLFP